MQYENQEANKQPVKVRKPRRKKIKFKPSNAMLPARYIPHDSGCLIAEQMDHIKLGDVDVPYECSLDNLNHLSDGSEENTLSAFDSDATLTAEEMDEVIDSDSLLVSVENSCKTSPCVVKEEVAAIDKDDGFKTPDNSEEKRAETPFTNVVIKHEPMDDITHNNEDKPHPNSTNTFSSNENKACVSKKDACSVTEEMSNSYASLNGLTQEDRNGRIKIEKDLSVGDLSSLQTSSIESQKEITQNESIFCSVKGSFPEEHTSTSMCTDSSTSLAKSFKRTKTVSIVNRHECKICQPPTKFCSAFVNSITGSSDDSAQLINYLIEFSKNELNYKKNDVEKCLNYIKDNYLQNESSNPFHQFCEEKLTNPSKTTEGENVPSCRNMPITLSRYETSHNACTEISESSRIATGSLEKSQESDETEISVSDVTNQGMENPLQGVKSSKDIVKPLTSSIELKKETEKNFLLTTLNNDFKGVCKSSSTNEKSAIILEVSNNSSPSENNVSTQEDHGIRIKIENDLSVNESSHLQVESHKGIVVNNSVVRSPQSSFAKETNSKWEDLTTSVTKSSAESNTVFLTIQHENQTSEMRAGSENVSLQSYTDTSPLTVCKVEKNEIDLMTLPESLVSNTTSTSVLLNEALTVSTQQLKSIIQTSLSNDLSNNSSLSENKLNPLNSLLKGIKTENNESPGIEVIDIESEIIPSNGSIFQSVINSEEVEVLTIKKRKHEKVYKRIQNQRNVNSAVYKSCSNPIFTTAIAKEIINTGKFPHELNFSGCFKDSGNNSEPIDEPLTKKIKKEANATSSSTDLFTSNEENISLAGKRKLTDGAKNKKKVKQSSVEIYDIASPEHSVQKELSNVDGQRLTFGINYGISSSNGNPSNNSHENSTLGNRIFSCEANIKSSKSVDCNNLNLKVNCEISASDENPNSVNGNSSNTTCCKASKLTDEACKSEVVNDSVLQESFDLEKYQLNEAPIIYLGRKGTHRISSTECLFKNVGKRFMNADDMSSLILEWNPNWLVMERKSNKFFDVCDTYLFVKDSYEDGLEYYNTYFPLHLLSMWLEINDSWKKSPPFFEAMFESQVVKPSCVQVSLSAVLDVEFPNGPKQDDVVLCTTTKYDETEEILFGRVCNVMITDSIPLSCAEDSNLRKIQFKLLCAELLDVPLLATVKIQNLSNIRVALLQNECLQNLNNSLKQVILNPATHTLRWNYFKLCSRKLVEKFKIVVKNTLNSLTSAMFLATIVNTSSPTDGIIMIYQIAQQLLKKHSSVLIGVKSEVALRKLADSLKSYGKVVIAVNKAEIKLTEELKKCTLEERSSIEPDVFKGCHVTLTLLSSFSLEEFASASIGQNYTCMLHEAHLCTETETALLLHKNVEKLLLVGWQQTRAEIHPRLNRYGYGISLFHRFCRAI